MCNICKRIQIYCSITQKQIFSKYKMKLSNIWRCKICSGFSVYVGQVNPFVYCFVCTKRISSQMVYEDKTGLAYLEALVFWHDIIDHIKPNEKISMSEILTKAIELINRKQ